MPHQDECPAIDDLTAFGVGPDGMRGIKFVVSDDHAGLKAARQAVLAGVPWQRFQFHLMQDAMAHVPKVAMQTDVAGDLRRL